jgi:hypothetical protein
VLVINCGGYLAALNLDSERCDREQRRATSMRCRRGLFPRRLRVCDARLSLEAITPESHFNLALVDERRGTLTGAEQETIEGAMVGSWTAGRAGV